MIDLRRLRYFMAVADELHFGRAAARLHISQPSLSQQIRVLEDELGARLLKRDRRSVSLTAAGHRLQSDGRDLLWRADEVGNTVGRIARGEAGRLTVGFVGPAMEGLLLGAIRHFQSRHPGIQLTLWQRGTEEQLRALRAGAQDLGLLRPFHHDFSGLESIVVDRQRYVLVLPKRHPFGRRRELRLAELGDEPLILFPRTTHPALHDRMMEACHEAGYSPAVIHEANTKAMALEMVRVGLGAALVPEGQTRAATAIAMKAVADPLPPVEITAAWRKDRETGPVAFLLEALQSP